MVSNVTGGRNGLADWMVQRVSAVILLAYTLFLAGVFLFIPEMQYADWRALFSHNAVRIFTLLAVVALAAHAWVGLWIIATDYLTNRMIGSAATGVRLVFLAACQIVLFIYLVWCVQILWSI